MRPRLLAASVLLLAACTGPGGSSTTQEATTQAPTSTLATTTEATTTTATPTTTETTVATTTTAAPTTTETTIAMDVPTGFEVHNGPGFVIALPAAYAPIDLDNQAAMQMLQDSPLGGEELNVAIQALQSGMITFWAFDLTDLSSGFAPNVNIGRQERTAFDEINVYLQTLADQYASIGVDVQSVDEVQMPFGPAVMAVSSFPIGDGTYTTAYQLFALTDTYVYVVTLSYLDPTSDQQSEAVAALMTFQPTE